MVQLMLLSGRPPHAGFDIRWPLCQSGMIKEQWLHKALYQGDTGLIDAWIVTGWREEAESQEQDGSEALEARGVNASSHHVESLAMEGPSLSAYQVRKHDNALRNDNIVVSTVRCLCAMPCILLVDTVLDSMSVL